MSWGIGECSPIDAVRAADNLMLGDRFEAGKRACTSALEASSPVNGAMLWLGAFRRSDAA